MLVPHLRFCLHIFLLTKNIVHSLPHKIEDIIIPPKLSDRTTSRVLVPSPLPRNMRPTTDAFESIVKRSTMNQPLVPPTIRSQNNAHRAGSDDVHLNLMVPPTISSAQKGTNAGNGQPSSQVIGILNSKPSKSISIRNLTANI